MSRREMAEIMKTFSTIKGALMWRCPFIGSLVSASRLKVMEDLDALAAVDKGRTIYINPEKWRMLSDGEKLAVIAHEVLHLAFRHAYREEKCGYNHELYNIAADACINHILQKNGFNVPPKAVFLSNISPIVGVPEEQLEKMSADTIYKLLEQKRKTILTPVLDGKRIPWIGGDLRPDLGGGEGGGEEEGEEISEAGERIDWDEYWRRAVSRAAVTAKQIGRLPIGIDRLFDILKPKVDWRVALREALTSGFRKIISSYRRPSRKVPSLPGHRRIGVSRGWIMVDCSGSIGRQELSQFASEIYDISRKFNAELIIIPWDVEVYEPQKVRTPGDITRIRLKGGGGTVIAKAVEKVAREMRPKDFVVILSDGLIYDIGEPGVQAKLSEISAKASAAVFVSCAADVRLPPRWRLIKIQ